MVSVVCGACNRTEDEAHRTGLYTCYQCAWQNPDYATRTIPVRPAAPINWPGAIIFSLILWIILSAIWRAITT